MSKITNLAKIASIMLTIACVWSSTPAQAVPNKYATSTSFKLPAAPSPSARPSTKLPNLGRDKHGMPFYHPKQLNRVVRTTAYTHTESDHIGYGPKNAISTYLVYNDELRSAAADWSVYPVGTKFKIKGQPYTYIVDDYGSALVGTGTIDIYHPSKALMRQWGRRIVEITVIEWGSSQQSLKQLAARTRYKHCKEMQTALQTQAKHSQTAQH